MHDINLLSESQAKKQLCHMLRSLQNDYLTERPGGNARERQGGNARKRQSGNVKKRLRGNITMFHLKSF